MTQLHKPNPESVRTPEEEKQYESYKQKQERLVRERKERNTAVLRSYKIHGNKGPGPGNSGGGSPPSSPGGIS